MNHLGSRAIARETAVLKALSKADKPIPINMIYHETPDWIHTSAIAVVLDDLIHAGYVEKVDNTYFLYVITDAGREFA